MSIITGTTWPPGPPPEPIRRITVEQYHDMIDAGILGEDDPVELLEGYLVEKMAKKSPHRLSTGLTREALEKIMPPGWYVDSQEPLTTADSEPEPDVYAARGSRRDYADRHPGPGDVALLVEVADSSLARDRGPKKRAYARAKIPIYWIVNLIDKQVEVHADPTGPAEQPDYRQKQIYKPGEAVPVILDGNEIGRIEVNAILP